MDYELVKEIDEGRAPANCYAVANTPDELAEAIERMTCGGWTITADTPRGHGFAFGQTVSGRIALMTNEFLDEDETRQNPDYRFETFADSREAVCLFRINGKPVFDCVKGCRIATIEDIPMIYSDE